MKKIKETAAGGTTSAGSIAVVPSNRLGGMHTRISLTDFMRKFHNGIVNRYNFKPVNENAKMTGSIARLVETAQFPYQLDDATSRLKNMQQQGEYNDERDVITYGIQDDNGNIMILTVPLQQGEEFERAVAEALAEVVEFKKTGHGEDKNLAQLLYELKDQFTIIDAQFPTIPKDAVYNADEISEDVPYDNQNNSQNDKMGDENQMDDMDNGPSPNQEPEQNPEESPADEFNPEDEDISDEFESPEDDKESLLVAVLGMLKSQNEKEIAQAKAEEEKAKAQQAQLSIKASEDEMRRQEKMVADEAELEAHKDREKRAKKMAELAKFNYRKNRGMSEGFSSIFRMSLLELDSGDTVQSLEAQRAVINKKYEPSPSDDAITRNYKREQRNLAMKELQVKIKAAQNQRRYNGSEQRQQQQQQPMGSDTDLS